VQIEYDVEVYGAEKKVQLPFVMGVLADLSGKPADPLAPVADRKFLEVDVDNFDSRMKAMKPRVAFPGAQRADGRRQPQRRHHIREHGRLLARGRGTQGRFAEQAARGASSNLQNLVTYMDGKGGAEELIGKLMADPALLGVPGRHRQAEDAA
jgi:type VI secretion system protein ImpB